MKIVAIDLGDRNTGEAAMIIGGSGTSLLVDSGDTRGRAIFNWLEKEHTISIGSVKGKVLYIYGSPKNESDRDPDEEKDPQPGQVLYSAAQR